MSRNPDHDRIKSVLLILAVGHETSWTNGRVENLPILQYVANLGSDGVPDLVEWGVVDSTSGLGRESSVSARGPGEGIVE